MSDFIRTSTKRIRGAATGEQNVPVKPEQFDDWLAEHDRKIQAQARRAVADEISSEAMSSDFLHDHVSDAGITWFVREIRESAEEIDGRHVHTWAGADLECACGERAARLTATTRELTT